MDNISICVQALRDLRLTKQHCLEMISNGSYVGSRINWTNMTDYIGKLGGNITCEDIRQLYHRGLSGPYVSKESRDFATAIMIVAEKFKLEPLNLERFM